MTSTATISRWLAAVVLCCCALGAHAQDLLVAQIGPFTGYPSLEPGEVRDGHRAYFEQVNRNGGIRGHKIQFFTLDDTLNGAVFLERFKEAMARHPIALIDPIGSAAIGSMLKSGVLDAADIVVVGAIPGALAFRQPGHSKLFHFRAGDKEQLERILLHCKTLGLARIHVLYQNVAVGESGLAVLIAGAEKLGGMSLSSSATRLDPESMALAANEAARLSPQGVIVIGFPQFQADAVAQLRKAGLPQATFSISSLDPKILVKTAGVAGARGVGITQVLPNPEGQNLPVQREFQAAMAKAFPEIKKYSPFHLEGYIAARVLVAGLRQINGTPTPTALAKALREMGEINLGGFSVNFAKGNVGGTWVDIGVMSPAGRLMY